MCVMIIRRDFKKVSIELCEKELTQLAQICFLPLKIIHQAEDKNDGMPP
jgi:hypothetical protein